MAERTDFWQGVITGALIGMMVAAWSRWDVRSFFAADSHSESHAGAPPRALDLNHGLGKSTLWKGTGAEIPEKAD